jgi:hydroxymethylpyrimidine pyrophosphatase-like HAD family hydrolase
MVNATKNQTGPASIKLLIIDIDGTLLNPDGKITPYTLATVQAAQAAGIVVTLATARRYCNTTPIANQLGLVGPLILYDGAIIVLHPDATILYSQSLQADVAQQAVDFMVHQHIQPVVHPDHGLTEEIWTGPPELDNLWLEAYFTTFPERMRRMPYESLCSGHPDPLRVVAFASEEMIQGLIPDIAALPCSWTTIRRGNYGSAEMAVMHPGCSKASGVVTLASRLGISLSEVMALGDNNNDIQMLQAVGWGVAMGQANEAVKAAANAITESNAEDGAAQAIDRYALRRAANVLSNSRKRTT